MQTCSLLWERKRINDDAKKQESPERQGGNGEDPKIEDLR